MPAYLEDSFLDRIRGAYRLALANTASTGPIWSPIDARRADINAALLDEKNDGLRAIFANPTTSDLYYGCDHLCRSRSDPIAPENFVEAALSSGRGRAAASHASRVAALCDQVGMRSVVEIGPGMGRAAFFAYCAGITDYTTVDLPLGIAAQACFLGRILGPDKLWFAGEAEQLARARIKLFSAGGKPNGRYGVALNVDSMTEMPGPEAFRYACWLGQHARLLLSINHAHNLFTVAELMAFAGMKCRERSAPLDVDGYVPDLGYREEVYTLDDVGLASVRRQAFSFFLTARPRLRRYWDLAQRDWKIFSAPA